MARAFAGTSGFAYKEWKPDFYPPDLPAKELLSYYASRFSAVEIDSTFYRMPNVKTLEGWRKATPPEFRFAVKASQKITHWERLKTPSGALDYLAGAVARLEERLGILFFQLPPNLRRDDERLERFLAALPAGLPSAFELRHASWFAPEVYGLLARHDAALCIHDADEKTTPLEVTASRVYLRLRRSSYPADALRAWQSRIRAWVAEGRDVFAFVKHEDNPDAPRIALELQAGVT